MTTTTAMPELPEPAHRGPTGTGTYFDSYTADQMRAYALATLQAQPAEVSDEEIIAIKKATKAADPTQPWGDTLAFARAILALRPQAVPMTDEQKRAAWVNAVEDDIKRGPMEWYYQGIEDAEAHRGITAPAGGEW